MLSGARQLHLVHGVFLTKELSAMSAVDAAIGIPESLAAQRIRAGVVNRGPLPMSFCDYIVGV
jgi:hypothetical protein